jgi:cysteine sulfinate desulfinase/cysteine desulfurase-like protein
MNIKQNLPNTLLLAVYMNNFCNIKMKEELEKNDIIISIGSACNTSDSDVSNVIKALQVPDSLRSGILRISMQDDITKECIIKFVSNFFILIQSDLVKRY